jgi:hypothetical protein
MVRWAVVASSPAGASRDPAPEAEAGGYRGTVIAAPPAEGAKLPVLYW